MKWSLVILTLLVIATLATVFFASASEISIHSELIQAFHYPVNIHIPIIPTTKDIKPETLQVKSHGQHVMAFIKPPAPYDIDDIVIETVILGYDLDGDGVIEEGEYVPTDGTCGYGDHGELIVTFDRGQVIALVKDLVCPGYVTLTVRGQVGDSMFSGSDCIKLVN